jgi:16S rRNA A1518/A1519 N6-dimethyltransferase RsmA/KsgA/DIM1 with predicted DNA glycosylase/AP lyase activity
VRVLATAQGDAEIVETGLGGRQTAVAFAELKISPQERAEKASLEQFVELAKSSK